MIESLHLRNFKSFADATLTVGGLTVVVGVNASGKSNLRDAFRFLHGIGRGYTLPEIIGGKYGEGGYREWGPLRGTTSEIVRFDHSSFDLEIIGKIADGRCFRYKINILHKDNYGIFYLGGEDLHLEINEDFGVIFQIFDVNELFDVYDEAGKLIPASPYRSGIGIDLGNPDTPDDRTLYGFRLDQPCLTQLAARRDVPPNQRSVIEQVIAILAAIRFLDLSPEAMRRPSFPGQTILGESGENLATVLQALCLDEERKHALIAWISELTPLEIADFEFESDATGRVILFLRDAEGGRISAFSASDGTLRFLAMAAALLSDSGRSLFFFEEIDTGLHPSRMRVLIDLIERRVAGSTLQVVTTTHSPDLLTLVGDKTFESTSVVYRPPGAGGSVIRRVGELPHIADLRKTQTLGRLHASGWFEDALYFDDPAEAAE